MQRKQDSSNRIQSTRYRIHHTEYKIQDTGYIIQRTRRRIQHAGQRIHNTGYMTQDGTRNKIQDTVLYCSTGKDTRFTLRGTRYTTQLYGRKYCFLDAIAIKIHS